jgi:hypothetical protein
MAFNISTAIGVDAGGYGTVHLDEGTLLFVRFTDDVTGAEKDERSFPGRRRPSSCPFLARSG